MRVKSANVVGTRVRPTHQFMRPLEDLAGLAAAERLIVRGKHRRILLALCSGYEEVALLRWQRKLASWQRAASSEGPFSP